MYSDSVGQCYEMTCRTSSDLDRFSPELHSPSSMVSDLQRYVSDNCLQASLVSAVPFNNRG